MGAVRDGARAETVTAHPPPQRDQQDPWGPSPDLPPHKIPALAAWGPLGQGGGGDLFSNLASFFILLRRMAK